MAKTTTILTSLILTAALILPGCVFKIDKACCCPKEDKNVAVDLQLEASTDPQAAKPQP